MKVKKIATAGTILLLLTAAGLGLVFKDKLVFLSGSRKVVNPVVEKATEKEKIKFDLTEWQDKAGFSFKYPQEMDVNDHPEDEVNYANLELTSKGREGKITIVCNDSQYASLDEWLEKDDLVKDGAGLETNIASLSAKKVALGQGREVAGLIDWDEVLYTIELQSAGEAYWRQAYAEILASFKLIPLEGESAEQFSNWLEGFDTSQADLVEAVEIIE